MRLILIKFVSQPKGTDSLLSHFSPRLMPKFDSLTLAWFYNLFEVARGAGRKSAFHEFPQFHLY